MNDFNEYVRESFSLAGDIVIRSIYRHKVHDGRIPYIF